MPSDPVFRAPNFCIVGKLWVRCLRPRELCIFFHVLGYVKIAAEHEMGTVFIFTCRAATSWPRLFPSIGHHIGKGASVKIPSRSGMMPFRPMPRRRTRRRQSGFRVPIIRSQMYLNPFVHSISSVWSMRGRDAVQPCRVVLKARTTSPGHSLF